MSAAVMMAFANVHQKPPSVVFALAAVIIEILLKKIGIKKKGKASLERVRNKESEDERDGSDDVEASERLAEALGVAVVTAIVN